MNGCGCGCGCGEWIGGFLVCGGGGGVMLRTWFVDLFGWGKGGGEEAGRKGGGGRGMEAGGGGKRRGNEAGFLNLGFFLYCMYVCLYSTQRLRTSAVYLFPYFLLSSLVFFFFFFWESGSQGGRGVGHYPFDLSGMAFFFFTFFLSLYPSFLPSVLSDR